MIFFKIIEKASSACQISVILCNQLTKKINTKYRISPNKFADFLMFIDK